MQHPHIAHHVPGRLRLRLPRAKGDPRRLHHIKQSLAPLPGVRNVEVNSLTGSVLIHYEPDEEHQIVGRVREHAQREGLFSLPVPDISPLGEFEKKIEDEAQFLAEHSRVAAWIVESVRDLDTEVRRATDNNLDLNVLVPLGLAGYSLLHHKADFSTPLWVTLALASLNSFIALHAQTLAKTKHAAPVPVRR